MGSTGMVISSQVRYYVYWRQSLQGLASMATLLFYGIAYSWLYVVSSCGAQSAAGHFGACSLGT